MASADEDALQRIEQKIDAMLQLIAMGRFAPLEGGTGGTGGTGGQDFGTGGGGGGGAMAAPGGDGGSITYVSTTAIAGVPQALQDWLATEAPELLAELQAMGDTGDHEAWWRKVASWLRAQAVAVPPGVVASLIAATLEGS